ncbi:unnamed protein product [Gongylonema pulchrum]|uniref:Guanylate cyclase domain-containing protein n=1 Tax=Gongylonema pulchrum TaxID=637853 RepID=A0A183ETX2_9BILA|nr:unnamed protein product [Gongylonema pulchrum]
MNSDVLASTLWINNPDKRVEILKNFALDRAKFKQETPLLDYALKVEKITTAKKANLILNVDGAIGIIFVDILRYSGMFTQAEAQETIEIGALNGLFVLGRSIGFVGKSMFKFSRTKSSGGGWGGITQVSYFCD